MDENDARSERPEDGSGRYESGGDGGGFQRRVLTEISPQAWEHPADRAALNALRKIPGFDLALRKIFGMFGERAIRLAFKANAVRVSEKQYAWIHERTLRVCETMDLAKVPEVYVSQTPVVNAGAVGMSDNVLKPLLLGRGVEVPMLIIFMGAIGGFILEGIIGLFVGAVVLAVGYTLFRAWLEEAPSA